LSAIDATKPMLVFLNNRFEVIQPAVFTFAGASGKIYLNYVLYRVTYNTAGTINDAMRTT
jgi:hypothetical protein